MATDYGAGGEFAQPYILGHEYGHHVQNLLNAEEQMRKKRKPISDNKLSVLIELQADCYSGVWAKNASGTTDEKGAKLFKSITQQDIKEGLETAAAIGDDILAKAAGAKVKESNFTHGTAAQRQEWFGRATRPVTRSPATPPASASPLLAGQPPSTQTAPSDHFPVGSLPRRITSPSDHFPVGSRTCCGELITESQQQVLDRRGSP